MKKGSEFFAVFKKELKRFFTDRRLVLSMLLPGFLIYFLYSFMGTFMYQTEGTYDVYVCQPSATFTLFLDSVSVEGEETFHVVEIEKEEVEKYKEQVASGEGDLVVYFDANFDEYIAALSAGLPVEGNVPQLKVYYNGADGDSYTAYSIVTEIYREYENAIANVFDVNVGEERFDLSTEESVVSYIASSILPFLLITFIMQGCMSVVPESIAGEKERGTMATMLVTPVSRSSIVFGKICALSIIASVSAASGFLGSVLSLPKLAGISISMMDGAYTLTDYLGLLLGVFSLVPLFVALASVLSTIAKTTKEASMYSSVLMLLSMGTGLVSMTGALTSSWYFSLIPLFNCITVFNDIFSMATSWTNIVISLAANLVYTVALVILLAKLFNSEKVMFRK